MGPIHALTLQLLVKRIISVDILDKTKVGTKTLNNTHAIMSLPNSVDTDGITIPAYSIPGSWNGLTFF